MHLVALRLTFRYMSFPPTGRSIRQVSWAVTPGSWIGELSRLTPRQEPETRVQRLKIESTLENGLIGLESDSQVRFLLQYGHSLPY